MVKGELVAQCSAWDMRLVAAGTAVLVLCGTGIIARADTVDCTPATCSWSIAVGGQNVETGTYTVNPGNGAIAVTGQPTWSSNGVSASITGVTPGVDPILGFNFSAGTGSASSNFTFSVSMPISLSGEIAANSSVSYSLTSLSSAGAGVQATADQVITAFEASTVAGGPAPFNKGVDVGANFVVSGGPVTQNSPIYTAANMFNLAAVNEFNEMVITAGFTLSAESEIGISGFVEQTPVPLPGAAWLFLSGGLGLLGLYRRRRSA